MYNYWFTLRMHLYWKKYFSCYIILVVFWILYNGSWFSNFSYCWNCKMNNCHIIVSLCQMFVFHRRNFPNVYNYTHVLCTDLWSRYERIVFIYVKVQVQKIDLKCNEMIMMMVMMMTLMIMMIKIKFKFKRKKVYI